MVGTISHCYLPFNRNCRGQQNTESIPCRQFSCHGKNKFLQDFPHIDNAAYIHIKMSQTKCRANESPQEYYFRMFAISSKGNIPASAIARHIVNGINDPDLKHKISNEYFNCNQLYRDINSYCNYNDVATPVAAAQKSKSTLSNVKCSDDAGVLKKSDNNNKSLNKIKCFNYSIKCPEPQRKERCKNCNRTTHRTAECTAKNIEKSGTLSNVNKIYGGVEPKSYVT